MFKVLIDNAKKVIFWSYLRSTMNEAELNKRLYPTTLEDNKLPVKEIVKSPKRTDGRQSMLTFSPDEIINRTYLTEPDEDRERFRANIVWKITEHLEGGRGLSDNPEDIKFVVEIDGDQPDEIVDYNDILLH